MSRSRSWRPDAYPPATRPQSRRRHTGFDLPDDPAESGIAGGWDGASVSTALQYLQRKVDPSLAYVLSCRRGLCDLCAVRIDGKVVTACTTPLRDGMLIEPTRASLQLRDTVVELSLVRRNRVG